MVSCLLSACLVIVMAARDSLGHGYLNEPASRGALWRLGYSQAPVDPYYSECNCGGREEQWGRNKGKCGTCGDPWTAPTPRDHENGGAYGNGVLVSRYTRGQVISVSINVAYSHKGSMSFSLCPLASRTSLETQDCFNRYPLRFTNGDYDIRVPDNFFAGNLNVSLVLPADVICDQCVLRWRYQAGNDWGCFDNGTCCVGCGIEQEMFYACSDIAIQSPGAGAFAGSQTTARLTTPRPTPQPSTNRPAVSGDQTVSSGGLAFDVCDQLFCRLLCRNARDCPAQCPARCRTYQL